MCAMKRLLCVAVALCALTSIPLAGQHTGVRPHWVGAWTTALIGRPPYPPAVTPAAGAPTPPPRLVVPNNQTFRQVVHTTLGGERLRVTLSNAFSAAPLVVGAAHVAVRAKDAALTPGTDRTLTFSGVAAITVPAGATVVSDPVALAVPAFTDLVVDLYLPDDVEGQPMTVHRGALQTS